MLYVHRLKAVGSTPPHMPPSPPYCGNSVFSALQPSGNKSTSTSSNTVKWHRLPNEHPPFFPFSAFLPPLHQIGFSAEDIRAIYVKSYMFPASAVCSSYPSIWTQE